LVAGIVMVLKLVVNARLGARWSQAVEPVFWRRGVRRDTFCDEER